MKIPKFPDDFSFHEGGYLTISKVNKCIKECMKEIEELDYEDGFVKRVVDGVTVLLLRKRIEDSHCYEIMIIDSHHKSLSLESTKTIRIEDLES